MQQRQIGKPGTKETTLTSLENKLTKDITLLHEELSNIREILDTSARDIAETRQLQISSMHVPHPLGRTSSTLRRSMRTPTPSEKEWQRKINATQETM